MEIKGYSNYKFENGKVFIKNGKEVKKQSRFCFKMKSDLGLWKTISLSTIEKLCGLTMDLTGYKEVPFTDGKVFVNKVGEVISFNKVKSGKRIKITYRKNKRKYPTVAIKFKGKNCNIGIHQIMALTFIDSKYLEKGLVCMHKNNNKNDFNLSNIKIGTYSDNNKQAYEDGVNLGRKSPVFSATKSSNSMVEYYSFNLS